jgi:hypothetical protein
VCQSRVDRCWSAWPTVFCQAVTMTSQNIPPDKIDYPRVYLDQWAFVRLAKVERGQGTAAEAALRDRLLGLVASGDVAFPLSFVHYLETWRAGDPTRRMNLAAEMIRFSQALTMAAADDLWRQEMDHALHAIFGTPAEVSPVHVWGRGMRHAFGEVGDAGDGDAPLSDEAKAIEMLTLAAAAGQEQFTDEQKARHERAQQFAEHQTAASARLAEWRTTPAERQLRFRLQALEDFGFDLIPVLIGADVTPDHFAALGEDGLERLVRSIPTIWALTELRRVRFQNPQQGFAPHDLNDLRALSASLVYCDIVVPDAAWWSDIRKADLDKQFNTVVVRRIADVEDAVASWQRPAGTVR